MIYRLVLTQAAFLLTILVKLSMSCECDMKHPQQHFCESDFVIIARVKNKATATHPERNKSVASLGFEKYHIEITRLFKRSNKIKTCDKSYVYTPLRIFDCGVRLCKDKRYVLTGHVKNNQLWVTSCDWVQDIHKVTRREKRGLRNYYKKSCDCQIQKCSGHKCGKLSADVCGMYTMVWSCYTRYGACIRRRKGKYAGKCMWKQNWYFHKCMEDHFYHHSRRQTMKRNISVVNIKKHKTRRRKKY